MIEKGLEITNGIFNANYNNQTYMKKLRSDWTVYGSDYKNDQTQVVAIRPRIRVQKFRFIRYQNTNTISMFFKFDEFLTAQMLGDVNYRLPSIVDAMTYTNAGVKTYLYYQGILTFPSCLQSILQFSFRRITFADNNQTSNRSLYMILNFRHW